MLLAEPFIFFGSLFVWVPLTLVLFIYLGMMIEYDKPVGAFIVLVMVTLFLQFFTTFKPFTELVQNPTSAVLFFGLYVVAGVIYSIFRWWRSLAWLSSKYGELKEKYLKEIGKDELQISDQDRQEMVHWIRKQIVGHGKSLPPKASEHKSQLTTWMAFWPICVPWTIFDDLLLNVWNWAYECVAEVFQKMSDRMFSKFNGDFR